MEIYLSYWVISLSNNYLIFYAILLIGDLSLSDIFNSVLFIFSINNLSKGIYSYDASDNDKNNLYYFEITKKSSTVLGLCLTKII